MRVGVCVCQCIKSEHRFPTPATIKSVTFSRYAGALRSTVEAHSAPGGRFMHSARRNVSNPEVACKGEGGGGGVGAVEGAPPPPLHEARINQKAKVFLHVEQSRLSRERVRWGGVILLSRDRRPVCCTALSSNHSETKSPAEGHLLWCKNGATKRLEGALKIHLQLNSPAVV